MELKTYIKFLLGFGLMQDILNDNIVSVEKGKQLCEQVATDFLVSNEYKQEIDTYQALNIFLNKNKVNILNMI